MLHEQRRKKISISEKSCYEEKRGSISTRHTVKCRLLYSDMKQEHINSTYKKQNARLENAKLSSSLQVASSYCLSILCRRMTKEFIPFLPCG